MIRVIVISGPSCSGSTSIAKALSEAIGWPLTIVGLRFRQYCETHRIPITDIPESVHRRFDSETAVSIQNATSSILEGRYLCHLSHGQENVLRVRVTADVEKRTDRCLARDIHVGDLDEATCLLAKRDRAEAFTAKQLYGIDDLEQLECDILVENNSREDLEEAVKRIVNRVTDSTA